MRREMKYLVAFAATYISSTFGDYHFCPAVFHAHVYYISCDKVSYISV